MCIYVRYEVIKLVVVNYVLYTESDNFYFISNIRTWWVLQPLNYNYARYEALLKY